MVREERPIFVVGYQRSGTTLLQALVGAHPRIAGPPETYFILRIAQLADWYGDLHDDGNLRRALHDFLHPPLPTLHDVDEDAVLAAALASDRTYRSLLDVVLHDFATRHGKARWCEKSPGQGAGPILQLFPDAQVIHIVRDPRDVVASSLETPWTTIGATRLARAWLAFTLANVQVGVGVGPAQFLQVRYEDLTRDPEAVLRLVCTFLGEDYNAGMLATPERRRSTVVAAAEPWQARALRPVEPGRNDWRTRLRRRDQARVAAVLDRHLPLLGYAPRGPAFVAAGKLLNLPDVLAQTAGARWARRTRPARDPRWRYERTQELLHRQAALVAADTAGSSVQP